MRKYSVTWFCYVNAAALLHVCVFARVQSPSIASSALWSTTDFSEAPAIGKGPKRVCALDVIQALQSPAVLFAVPVAAHMKRLFLLTKKLRE